MPEQCHGLLPSGRSRTSPFAAGLLTHRLLGAPLVHLPRKTSIYPRIRTGFSLEYAEPRGLFAQFLSTAPGPITRFDQSQLKWKKNDKEELLRRGQSGDWVNIGKYFKRT